VGMVGARRIRPAMPPLPLLYAEKCPGSYPDRNFLSVLHILRVPLQQGLEAGMVAEGDHLQLIRFRDQGRREICCCPRLLRGPPQRRHQLVWRPHPVPPIEVGDLYRLV